MASAMLGMTPSADFEEENTVGITQAFTAMDVSTEDSHGELLLQDSSNDLHDDFVDVKEEPHHDHAQEEDEEELDDSDFSFVCADPNASTISADDIFFHGQIRPMFPLFNQDLLFADTPDRDPEDSDMPSPLRSPLRKVFVEKSDYHSSSSSSDSDDLEGVQPDTYCAWSGKAVDASPGPCKKSNSTGFSKLWRFRDLAFRSNSDGKDAFVFLDPSAAKAKAAQTREEAEVMKRMEKMEVSIEKKLSADGMVHRGKIKGKAAKEEKKMSAHETYLKDRASREEGRRKHSYLPYRNVGFFTNVNGLSRNVHPF